MVDLPSFQEQRSDAMMGSVKDSVVAPASSGRGRKPIPLKWSRIVDLQAVDGQPLEIFDINVDTSNVAEEQLKLTKQKKARWMPLFEPKDWWLDNVEHDLESNELKKRTLKALSKGIIDKRQLFNQRALQLLGEKGPAPGMSDEDVKKLSKRLRNRDDGTVKETNPIKGSEYIVPVSPSCRRRGSKRAKLTVGQKIKIVHKVIHWKVLVQDVAKEFRITSPYVSNLVSKARRNPKFLEEMIAEEDTRITQSKAIAKIIERTLRSGAQLHNVKETKEMLQKEHGIEIKDHKLLEVMHKELSMRYRNIDNLSFQCNSKKNRILRQQFALAFLRINLMNKTVINVDETWIGMTDFRRKKWTLPDMPNGIPKKNVQPRISMIVGVDTNG